MRNCSNVTNELQNTATRDMLRISNPHLVGTIHNAPTCTMYSNDSSQDKGVRCHVDMRVGIIIVIATYVGYCNGSTIKWMNYKPVL